MGAEITKMAKSHILVIFAKIVSKLSNKNCQNIEIDNFLEYILYNTLGEVPKRWFEIF